MSAERLTALDASFVWFERPGVPVHVGAVATFEAAPLLDASGRLRLAEIRDRVAARLDALPRLRRRLAPVPFDVDRPHWVDDPDFDVARHVGEMRLPAPADDATLRRVAGELHSEVLPRDRPLWDIRFLTGLDGGRVALVERVHHALVDGVSGVDLATILLDLEPDAPAPAPTRWSPARPPGPSDLLAAGLRDRLADPVRAARSVAHMVRHPAGAARTVRTLATGLAPTLAGGFAPHTSLNGRLAGGRRLAWIRTDLAAVHAAGRDATAPVNDVVLAAVAGGVRELLLGRGERLREDTVLKVLVPVSLRRADEHGTLGNRVGAYDAPLPVGIDDPGRCLAAVAAEMRRYKARPQADASGILLAAADLLPPVAAQLLTRAVEHQRIVNLVVTNVPGPPLPLYAAGSRMLEAFPVVPLGANLTLGVAVLSYDGALTITLTADDLACPDVDVCAAGIERSLARLGVATVPAPSSRPAAELQPV